MFRKKIKYFFISLFSFISFDSLLIIPSVLIAKGFPIEELEISEKYNYKKYIDNNNKQSFYSIKDYSGLSKDLNPKLSKSKTTIANLENKENKETLESGQLFVDITSDTKYQIEGISYAEGNVIVNYGNSLLNADIISYDPIKRIFIAKGNVRFRKGDQYFECIDLQYNFKEASGFINEIYGVLNIDNFQEDFNLKKDILDSRAISFNNTSEVRDLNYLNSVNIGVANDFSQGKKFKITNLNFEVPQITKWRFKSKKVVIDKELFRSDKIYFTNDVFNEPQFFLESNNFIGKFENEKLKLISKNTWINLEDKFKFPIGRRTIFDRDPISKWGIGSDYDEKDGFYIARGFDNLKVFDDFNLRITPFFLFQRAIKGSTNSYREKGSSIFSNKVNGKISMSDIFALNTYLEGKLYSWDFNLNTTLNSFDIDRLHESSRAKLSISKSFDLNKKDSIDKKISQKYLNKKIFYENFLDIEFTSGFRENIDRGFDGEAEIYFANSIGIGNRKSWSKNGVNTGLTFTYGLGEYTSEKSDQKELDKLFRNVFASNFSYTFPLWEKKSNQSEIDQEYRYSPLVINQGIRWISNINTGLFFYSDGSKQELFSINTGPELIFGSFKSKFLDYTKFRISATYVAKNGESPFVFDNFNETERLKLDFQQQLIGPLVFNYESYLNLENGEFIDQKFGLDISRRAYYLGSYYYPEKKEFGLRFKIFNFNYSGMSSKF